MTELKHIEVDGVKYTLAGQASDQPAAQQFTFRSTKEEIDEALNFIVDGIIDESLMEGMQDESALMDLIIKYCVKSREDIGLTDEVLAKVLSGETMSQYIMEAGAPLLAALNRLSEIMGSQLLPGTENVQDAVMPTIAPSSFFLSGCPLECMLTALDIARGRMSATMGGDSSSSSSNIFGQFLNGRGLGLPVSLLDQYLPLVSSGEPVAILGYFADWGMGMNESLMSMLLGGSLAQGDSWTPYKLDMECLVLVTETDVVYTGVFIILFLALLLAMMLTM